MPECVLQFVTLNQLKTAGEGSSSWSQTYGYDNRNNRYVSANQGFALNPDTPTQETNFDAMNRLLVNGAAYDPSGTGTQLGIGGYLYTFDAENRLVQAAEGISPAIRSAEVRRSQADVARRPAI